MSAPAGYAEFLASKGHHAPSSGFACESAHASPSLFDHQRHITAWSVRRGRSAVWADTGLGKTRIQADWLRLIRARAGGCGLILAPFAGGALPAQTISEAAQLGIRLEYAHDDAEAAALMTGDCHAVISNYERLHKFDPARFNAVVLDESSILKSYSGPTKRALVAAFKDTPYRLCCTATPAPNDLEELCNHADFLGIMSPAEMRSTFFIADSRGEFMKYRIKGHAKQAFYDWLASWAIACRTPADLGFDGSAYVLPELRIIDHIVETGWSAEGELFTPRLQGVGQRTEVRHDTLAARVAETVALIAAEPGEQWIAWCGLNAEADAIAAAIPGAVNVQGSDSDDAKASGLLDFAEGRLRVLVTKPSIAGFGMNLQSCARMAFCGLSDCYDDQTEVLTRLGWKSFGKVTLDDDVATVSPDTQAFEWQAPTRVVWEHYSGPMLRYHGQRNFDLLVTPNHKLYVQRCPIRYASDGKWELRYAADLADRFRRQEYRMLSAPARADGDAPEFIEIPAYGRINSRSRTVSMVSAADFVQLAGWYLTEGYCRPMDSAERGRIVICQTGVNPENRAEIIALLTRLGLSVNSRTKDITAYSVNLAAYLMEQFGSGSYEKRIPRWIKDLHPDLLVILRDTMMKGDGSADRRYYKSFSAQLRDDFQEICLRTGIRASVHKDYVSLAWQNIRPAISAAPEIIEYDGMIGCATVPNHTLIVRRNGIPVVSGNSYEDYHQAIRRCWRFGQARPVDAHIVLADAERPIAANVRAKQRQSADVMTGLISAIAEQNRRELFAGTSKADSFEPVRPMSTPDWLRSAS